MRIRTILLALVAAIILAGGWTWDQASAATTGHGRIIYIKSLTKQVSEATLQDYLPAFQASIEQYESKWYDRRYWGGPITLRVIPGNEKRPADGWAVIRVLRLDSLDYCQCYGFHDVWWANKFHRDNVPYALVGEDPTEMNPVFSWTVTLTHELIEMAKDPFIHQFHRVGNRRYLLEPGDPVEDIAYPLPSASGVPVYLSDFVLPHWYEPGSAGPYDWLNMTPVPFALTPGGFVSWKDMQGHWHYDYIPAPRLRR